MPVLDWDSVDSHKKFMASPEYRPFNDHLSKIVTATKLYHFHPSPCPPSVLDSAPVVEMAMFFGASDDFNSNVGKFMEGIEAAEGKQGYSHGPVLEELSKDEDQKPAKAVQLCIGWESVEAHMKFRETDLFQEHIHYLRKGTSGARLVGLHVGRSKKRTYYVCSITLRSLLSKYIHTAFTNETNYLP